MKVSGDFGIWVAVAFTFAIFSLVFYKENPFYRLAEHVFIGIGAGHAIVTAINVIINTGWTPAVQKAQYAMFIPLILGALLFARYSKNYAAWARPSIAIIIATGAGLGLRGAIYAQFLDQIKANFLPLNSIDNALILFGVLATLSYFFFTRQYTGMLSGPLQVIPKVGRWALMIAFGASFGNATMGFLSVIIGRMMFLMRDWLGLIQ